MNIEVILTVSSLSALILRLCKTTTTYLALLSYIEEVIPVKMVIQKPFQIKLVFYCQQGNMFPWNPEVNTEKKGSFSYIRGSNFCQNSSTAAILDPYISLVTSKI